MLGKTYTIKSFCDEIEEAIGKANDETLLYAKKETITDVIFEYTGFENKYLNESIKAIEEIVSNAKSINEFTTSIPALLKIIKKIKEEVSTEELVKMLDIMPNETEEQNDAESSSLTNNMVDLYNHLTELREDTDELSDIINKITYTSSAVTDEEEGKDEIDPDILKISTQIQLLSDTMYDILTVYITKIDSLLSDIDLLDIK